MSDLEDVYFKHEGAEVRWSIEDVLILKPTASAATVDRPVFPHACREGHSTYSAPATARLRVTITQANGTSSELLVTRNLGQVPIMVRSRHCHLYNMTPAQLVQHHEEQNEAGGFFIVNGNEKVVRMLTVARRNDVSCWEIERVCVVCARVF